MSYDVYLMDTDFCSECGRILLYFEVDLCEDCREEFGSDEYDQGDYDEGWDIYY